MSEYFKVICVNNSGTIPELAFPFKDYYKAGNTYEALEKTDRLKIYYVNSASPCTSFYWHFDKDDKRFIRLTDNNEELGKLLYA